MITALVFLTLALPPGESEDTTPAGNSPSLELLEYIGGMPEDENGRLIDPMDLPAAESAHPGYSSAIPDTPSVQETPSTP
ncbi:hypothetical protein [Thiolapillus brandeum]|uniref:Uncharacterized protein n=1 Tax=Thiolapillus brandeum TaxID=1076588 RepID=A0A7U6GK87_9GAMM|nr:hypothetical protein [Thiolapillus brandeum]BAO45176.1 hypothetical protein TBH_C2265 [Thiolapillus brandeum]